MKVLIAIDSFKGSISSAEAEEAVSRGIQKAIPGAETVCFPVADGGEGTAETLVKGRDGSMIKVDVTGPLGEIVNASYGWLPDDGVAVIETAQAAGLPLVPEDKRNPLNTTSFGVGEFIKDALDKGIRKILLGLGGSATNDGGMGMLRALGARFRDEEGNELEGFGRDLLRVREVDLSGLDARLGECSVSAACDVKSVLFGPEGAAYIFAPQKGAGPAEVMALDEGLRKYAAIMEKAVGKDHSRDEGSGAAGGLGFALRACLNAELRPGTELVLSLLGFDRAMEGVDVVVTGEGCIDHQTPRGKVPCGVGRRAHELGAYVIAFAGKLGENAEICNQQGIDAMFSICRGPVSCEEAMKRDRAMANLELSAEQVFRLFR